MLSNKIISSTFGKNLKVTIFGGSHEPEIGVTIQGLPEGVLIDFEKMQKFLDRRAPGKNIYSTPRKEPDIPLVQSGFFNGKTTGDLLTLTIKNTNIRSGDYSSHRDIPRPSHADFTAAIKYGNSINMAGGGPFSARMTAPLCIAGAIAIQMLEAHNIFIGAHILSISRVYDTPFDAVNISKDDLLQIKSKVFPVIDADQGGKMADTIKDALYNEDSVGGIIECCALGVPIGLGGPMYDSLEGHLSQIFFGIPALKGLEFGNGFGATHLLGSQNNDAFMIKDGKVQTKTNHHGGILGGISSGMPLICKLAFKPTPSIAQQQDSVSLSKGINEKLKIIGRHDPCVVLRAVPIVEAAMAIGILDLLIGEGL